MMTTTCTADEQIDGVKDEDSRPYSPLQQYLDEDDSSDESIDSLIERCSGRMQPLIHLDADEDYDDVGVVSKPIVRLKLPLYEAPEFIQRLRGYNEVSAGTSVSFVAHYKAIPTPTVKWYKDEEEVRATERHHLESSSSEHEGIIRLIITDVKTTDEGAYKCKVENQEGVASTTGYLSVTGGDTRSRQTARTSSSRNGKLPSPCRVSSPPLLRPIAEQKSIEESEELELSRQPPSPLQAFIDSIKHSTKSRHPPICYGAEHIFGKVDDENDSTNDGSDGEDDVFGGEEDAVSQTTSSDSLEQLLTISPTTTGDDCEVCSSPTETVGSPGLPWADLNDYTKAAVDVKPSESVAETGERLFKADEKAAEQNLANDIYTRLSSAESAVVPDSLAQSTLLSTRLTTTTMESNGRSPSTFHQRRLGRLQQQHRLAIDLADYTPTTLPQPVSSDKTSLCEHNVAAVCDEEVTAFVKSTTTCFASPSIPDPIESSCRLDVGDLLRVVQDTVLDTIDNPVFQFYTVFVALAATLANIFDVQPLCLILVVALTSFISFHWFGQQHSLKLSKYPR